MKSLKHLCLICCLAISFVANADQSVSSGDYTVHYSAFSTDILSAEIAKTYGIKRSKSRALINISILKKVMETTGTPVKGSVKGTATNLHQQLKQLEFKELDEGVAVYYLAEINVKNEETLTFNLSILPEGESKAFDVKFSQQFYTN